MPGKSHIVPPDRRLWADWIARGILGSDERGEEEEGGRERVSYEA